MYNQRMHKKPAGRPPKPFDHYLKRNDLTGCIEWTGHLVTGYGQYRYRGRDTYAHRVAYERAFGPIPKGLLVLHRCDNPCCCNPDHLFLGTHADNMKDKTSKGRQATMPGEKNPAAKLTPDDVITIRRLCNNGERQKDVGLMFGITQAAVSLIVTRQKWHHIP